MALLELYVEKKIIVGLMIDDDDGLLAPLLDACWHAVMMMD